METLLKIVQTVNSYLSDYILIVMLVAAGLFFSIKTRFVQVRYFGAAMRKAFGEVKLFGKKHDSGMSSFQALATAIFRHGDDIRRSRPRADHACRP